MTKSELKAMYDAECASRRITPQPDELAKWFKAALHFEKFDVQAGLDRWNADRTIDNQGQLKSKWLPSPVELVQCVEHAYRARLARTAEPKGGWIWRCPVCNYLMSGFIPQGASTRRHCPSNFGPTGSGIILQRGAICGHDMEVTPWPSDDKEAA